VLPELFLKSRHLVNKKWRFFQWFWQHCKEGRIKMIEKKNKNERKKNFRASKHRTLSFQL